jgi:hypothetical protein
MAFLALKDNQLPVGRTISLNFTNVAQAILQRHYRPTAAYEGFYTPFRTSRKDNRWVRPRYGSTTLQRITKDTFGDALLHPDEQSWGWREDYIAKLRGHLNGLALPAYEMAVWLFRDEEWPDNATPSKVRDHFFRRYGITSDEVSELFDPSVPDVDSGWSSNNAVSEAAVLEIIGSPPGAAPGTGGALRRLELRAVGPAMRLVYEPADRLNIVTGDNSVGKTFLLDCIWWALTGSFSHGAAQPTRDVPKTRPSIGVRIGTTRRKEHAFSVKYNWDIGDWEAQPKRNILPGLAVYARFDGSFNIYDPSRIERSSATLLPRPRSLRLRASAVWDGLGVGEDRICNGLLDDWLLWKVGGGRYRKQFEAMTRCLRVLSPSDDESLELSEPVRLRGSREIPTFLMPYGRVPVTIASAGVKRISALAYALVWSWFEHLQNSIAVRRPPQQAMVLLIDEVEAHLHPRWQRVIIPALVKVVRELAPGVAVQLHVATHSPLVMASAEPSFDNDVDKVHHLRIDDKQVILEEFPFVKRGTADAWLMSDVFGLKQPRSREAERAIESAKLLQLVDAPSPRAVKEANKELTRLLAPDDEFWPRWRYFAESHGGKE